jgi:ABC-2 type transport system permease protein
VRALATLLWYARHEARLAWRDWLALMTAQGRWRVRSVAIALAIVFAFMHVLALTMVGRLAEVADRPDRATLLVITGGILLSWSLMLSQAMESVTRAFYSRADLDLILSSPAPARTIFSVRLATLALALAAMALALAAPFINVLALLGGARWLGAYGVVFAMGAAAAAVALAVTFALFRLIGPRRTRLLAQIMAAVIGAGFVIGLQVGAILSYGTLSRTAILQSKTLLALAPAPDSILWWPARAALGDGMALAAVLALSIFLLAVSIAIYSARFGEHALAVAALAKTVAPIARRAKAFRQVSAGAALRRKEWTLILRDPWLMSQTLMQLLYLLPPALLLWRSFADGGGEDGGLVLLVPVLVMAAGQLAGGLAWLAVSGEDAPDLVATAPVAARAVMRAKVEAVLGAIAIVFAPLLAMLAIASPYSAAVAAAGILVAAASATAVQLWFRAQAKRSHFRRRQTSSRLATFAEAFSSITWAATAALAAAGTELAVITALIALAILAAARQMRPRERASRWRAAPVQA